MPMTTAQRSLSPLLSWWRILAVACVPLLLTVHAQESSQLERHLQNTPEVEDQFLPCIAVVSKGGPSQEALSSSWDSFRSNWPDRPFCLLEVIDAVTGDLMTPANFATDSNMISRYSNMDGGDVWYQSDWFDTCDLYRISGSDGRKLQLDQVATVALLVQVEDPNDIAASYQYFLDNLNNRGIDLEEVEPRDDLNWILPFDRNIVAETAPPPSPSPTNSLPITTSSPTAAQPLPIPTAPSPAPSTVVIPAIGAPSVAPSDSQSSEGNNCTDYTSGECDFDPFRPVTCGPDNSCPYDNFCHARANGFDDPETQCCQAPQLSACTLEYDPKVCGTKQCPYSNLCLAQASGYTEEQCTTPPPDCPIGTADCSFEPSSPHKCGPFKDCSYETVCDLTSAGWDRDADCCQDVRGEGICPAIFAPVSCGSASKQCTYDSQCQADGAGYNEDQCCRVVPDDNACSAGNSTSELASSAVARASDGNTAGGRPVECGELPCMYANQCEATAAGYEAEDCCPTPKGNTPCILLFQPVHCGGEDQEKKCGYSNYCIAGAAGFNETDCCPAPLDEDISCNTTDPVKCGATECSYDNECLAAGAGFIIEAECCPVASDCEPDNTTDPVLCDDKCYYHSQTCANNVGFNVDQCCRQLRDLEAACPLLYAPVACGSINCVYDNDCLAELAGYDAASCVQLPIDNPPTAPPPAPTNPLPAPTPPIGTPTVTTEAPLPLPLPSPLPTPLPTDAPAPVPTTMTTPVAMPVARPTMTLAPIAPEEPSAAPSFDDVPTEDCKNSHSKDSGSKDPCHSGSKDHSHSHSQSGSRDDEPYMGNETGVESNEVVSGAAFVTGGIIMTQNCLLITMAGFYNMAALW